MGITAETNISTPHGALTMTAMNSCRLALCCGAYTGWCQHGNRGFYVAGYLDWRADGVWTWANDNGGPRAYPLKDGTADWKNPLPPEAAAPMFDAMRDTALAWLRSHPEFMAKVEVEETAFRAGVAQGRVLDLRDELARAEKALADALAAQEKANARMAAVRAIDSDEMPAP